MSDNTIDALKIEVEYSNNTDAVKNLDKIASALKKVQKACESLTGLPKITRHLSNLNDVSLSKITSQINKFVRGLKELSSISKKTGKIGKIFTTDSIRPVESLAERTTPLERETITEDISSGTPITPRTEIVDDSIPHEEITFDTSSVEAYNRAMERLREITDIANTRMIILSENKNKLDDVLARNKKLASLPEYKEARITSDDTTYDNNQYKETIATLGELAELITSPADLSKLNEIIERYNELNKQIERTSDSARQSSNIIGRLGANEQSVSKYTKSLIRSIGRVALYRILRAIFSKITQAVKKGLDNVAQYSDKVNESMSNIKSYSLMISNSLGAAFAALLNFIEPVIIALAKGVVFLSNSFNQLFSTLSGGSDTFIKAKLTVEDYAKALKKANSTALGFDELNIVGNQANQSDMFEQAKITNSEIENTNLVLGSMWTVLGAVCTKLGTTASKFGKIGAIITLVLAVVRSIVKTFADSEEMQEKGKNLWENIKQLIISVKKLLDNVVSLVLDILDQLQPVLDIITRIVVDVLQDLLPIITDIIYFVCDILDALKPLITWIINILMPLLKSILSAVQTILKPVIKLIKEFVDVVIKIVGGILKYINGLFSGDLETMIDGLWIIIKNLFSGIVNLVWNLIHVIDGVFTGIAEIFLGLFETIVAVLIKVHDSIVGILSTIVKWIYNSVLMPIGQFFVDLWNGIKNVWSNVSSFFVDIFTLAINGIKNAWNGIGNFFSRIWDGIKNGFIGFINGVTTGFEGFLNFIVKGINWIIGGINKISINFPDWLGGGQIGFNISNMQEVSFAKIPAYADGGYGISSGQMFIARESGPELVGSIGNKSSVANNEQIIGGIKQGVYEAVMLAQQQTDNDFTIEVKTYLDGKVVSDSVEKYQKRKGQGSSIYKGGILNGI